MHASYSIQTFQPDHVTLVYGWWGPDGTSPARGWHLTDGSVSGFRRLSGGRLGKERRARRISNDTLRSVPWLKQLAGRFLPDSEPDLAVLKVSDG